MRRCEARRERSPHGEPMTIPHKDAFLSRVRNDRSGPLPVFLRDLTLGLDVINARTTDVFTSSYDHELAAKAVAAFQRLTGQDAVVGCIHSAAFAVESFGGVMKYPEYGVPSVSRPPLGDLDDLPRDVSIDPVGKAVGAIRSYSAVRAMLPDVAVVANVAAPLTKAGVLMGMTKLALCLETDRSFVEEVVGLSVAHTKACIERLHDDGSIDCVFLAGASDNPDLFGPGVYRELSLRWLRVLVDHCHRLGYPIIFHPHGVFTSAGTEELIGETVATGIDGFQFAEDNDPAKIISLIGGRCSVLGGTNVVPTLIEGTEDQVRSETKMYIDACRPGSHVFMCSCSLHRGTDLHRVCAMVDEARKRGTNGNVA